MSDRGAELALLPNGFVDLLPPKAEVEARSITTLMKKFASFGYQRIKPPLMEFEDSLLAPGPGELLADETFRVMDPVTHRMLGLRSDITPQVARIAMSRLMNEPRPLRLTYANDVLRTKGNQLRTVRQFCQVGCEIIGDESADTDIEVAVLAVLGLKALELKNITLDFTVPGLVNALIDESVDVDTAEVLRKAVSQRDRQVLDRVDGEAAKSICLAMELSSCEGGLKDFLNKVNVNAFPKLVREDLERLCAVCKGIEAALVELDIRDVSVTVDLLEQAGFEYHKHIGFTLFAKTVHGELGRGGSYDVCFGHCESDEVAKGFTLYMDTIQKACPFAKEKKHIYVPASESWADIRTLQKDGWIVYRGSDKTNMPEECTHRFENGEIKEI